MQDSAVRKFHKQDWIIAGSLFLLGLVTRIPLASCIVYAGDPARFALAMQRYDVSAMRPHAPGYILYVGAAKLLDLILGDTNASLVGVSILSSASTLSVLYLLGTRMFGRPTGIISAVLLASSPVAWFYGGLQFTYAMEALFATLFAYACYGLISGESRNAGASAVLLGLTAGVRQHLGVLLFPLWLYALRRHAPRQILLSFSILAVTCLAWLIPMVLLSGGVEKYVTAVVAQYTTWVSHPASFLYQILGRGRNLIIFAMLGLGLGVLPMLYHLGGFFRLPSVVEDARLHHILFWIVPAVIFLVTVNMFNPGQIVWILPPLFIFLAESTRALSRDAADGAAGILRKLESRTGAALRLRVSPTATLATAVTLLFLVNTSIFLLGDTQVSHATMRNEDLQLSESIRMTREHFAPETTMLLACRQNTQAALYLPDYRVYCPFPLIYGEDVVSIDRQNVYVAFGGRIQPETYWRPTAFRIEPIPIPEGVDTLVVWEDELAGYYQGARRQLSEIRSDSHDVVIHFLQVNPPENIHYAYHRWSVNR